MIKIELTQEEAQVLVNLMNIAVQAKGLEAAESALHFTKKVQEAAKLNNQNIEKAQAAVDPSLVPNTEEVVAPVEQDEIH